MIPPSSLMARMRRVPVEAIEQELENEWRSANASALAMDSHPGTRNSVLTLVVYTYEEETAAQVLATVEEMTGVHPSRAIVLAAEPEGNGTPLEAYIDTRLHEVTGTSAYAEEILLEARGEAVTHLPSAVLPLIVSGLPSYLWWTGEPPWRTEQLEALVDGSDRLIVDTSEMLHPERALVALDDLVHRKKSSSISDLNWTRQAPWRELIAQFFDAPTQRPFLYGIDRLSIEYAADDENLPSNTAAAYLFTGWLGSRVGWRFSGGLATQGDAGREHTLTDGSGRRIMVEIQPRFDTPIMSWRAIHAPLPDAPGSEPCVGPGALMSVHLHAAGGGQTATFAVAREADLIHASTLAQTPLSAMPSQTVHLPSIGEAALLGEQLRLIGHDEVYEDALSLAAMLIGPGARRAVR
jgi:glucose-6-phosphate dehydrogenase assembly protein OpcA